MTLAALLLSVSMPAHAGLDDVKANPPADDGREDEAKGKGDEGDEDPKWLKVLLEPTDDRRLDAYNQEVAGMGDLTLINTVPQADYGQSTFMDGLGDTIGEIYTVHVADAEGDMDPGHFIEHWFLNDTSTLNGTSMLDSPDADFTLRYWTKTHLDTVNLEDGWGDRPYLYMDIQYKPADGDTSGLDEVAGDTQEFFTFVLKQQGSAVGYLFREVEERPWGDLFKDVWVFSDDYSKLDEKDEEVAVALCDAQEVLCDTQEATLHQFIEMAKTETEEDAPTFARILYWEQTGDDYDAEPGGIGVLVP